MTCEIEKDRVWVGQYECATHGVWYRDSDKKPKELCPVGEAEAEVERLKAHTWQQERAAIVAWLNHVANHVGVDLHMTPDEFVDEISNFANLFEAGEHWPEGGEG